MRNEVIVSLICLPLNKNEKALGNFCAHQVTALF